MRLKHFATSRVEIAKSIRVPYASESLSVSECECHPYKEMHIVSFIFLVVIERKLSAILYVSIVFFVGENQASRVRTTRSKACGACSGG